MKTPPSARKTPPTKQRKAAKTITAKANAAKTSAAVSRRGKAMSRPRKRSPLARWLRQCVPGWPKWLGAAIVAATCWGLYKVFASRTVPAGNNPPAGYAVHGIDISHHQGKVDWELLRNRALIDGQPVCFAFIKATEGTDMVDSRFSQNFAAAKKYGIVRGAYHFYRPSAPAKQQAEHFIRLVRLEEGDLPPVLDVEVKPAGISDEDFRQGVLEWLLRAEQHYRVKPILYTYHSFRLQYMRDSIFNIYPYWIAHYYVDSVRYRGPWAFWQHSDKGELPGIREKVDLDIFRGTFDELQRLTINRKTTN